MRVFLSWSGRKSRDAAELFAAWLRALCPMVDPWLSTAIEKGTRWQTALSAELEESTFGIVFLTADNQREPWLHFEAGAISKARTAHLCPFLLDLESAHIDGPLAQFEHTLPTSNDVLALVQAIARVSRASGHDMPSDDALTTAFQRAWPRLSTGLAAIAQSQAQGPDDKSLMSPAGFDNIDRRMSELEAFFKAGGWQEDIRRFIKERLRQAGVRVVDVSEGHGVMCAWAVHGRRDVRAFRDVDYEQPAREFAWELVAMALAGLLHGQSEVEYYQWEKMHLSRLSGVKAVDSEA